ncbi:hypothetical protein SAMN04487866_12626 [Thermoactinomyces sp. DSM 45891]|uniref:hypothetical protein n=1 Tax=Thermoactinomyces sp. DSM 45891 TaxID=1761907 RepID=UPI00091CB675|nr:hypothetical protein [Thermoactinomyces sp. DSM 45891]SFX79560.1 hypothetical protein SAMN04487866_12626 [Thermoactinomyces sp. DSM 45891]
MKKMAIITEKGFLIRDASEIERVIFVGYDLVVENIPLDHIDELNKKLKSYLDYDGLTEEEIEQLEEDEGERKSTDKMNLEELERFFKWAGYSDVEISYGDEDGEKPREFITYTEYNTFQSYTKYEESMVYDWWDGNDYRRFSFDSVYILEVTDEAVSLDEWSERARGHVTGGSNEHQKVYKVITEDGKLQRDQYLIEKWDDYQGSYPLGELVDSSYLKIHLEDLSRDVDEYMDEITSLGK